MSAYLVDDLQACEPDALPTVEGITVTIETESDEMGFPRVAVEGPSREAVLAYVRAAWGDDDETGGWFTEWVVDRVQPAPSSPNPS